MPKRGERDGVRERGLPRERDWERSALLEPLLRSRIPTLISDGGGLPFPPAALSQPPGRLDPDDPAVDALLVQLGARAAPKPAPLARFRRGTAPSPPAPAPVPAGYLDHWRQLARTETEALFGRGLPPRLLTVAIRQDRRRGGWACIGTTSGRALRAARDDGVRASSWRLDPGHELSAEDDVLRILVTEQRRAGGRRADGRVLPPELHEDEDELTLTIFVTPLSGFQLGAPNPETPVRVALRSPVGSRTLLDGALYDPP